MIVSASYRTDIPAFYPDWLMARLHAGWCEVRNPFGGQIARLDLTSESLDGIVLWTKNLAPLLDALPEIRARAGALYVQYTINGYPAALERSVTPAGRALGHVERLARDFGGRAAVWRYDPVILTSLTPADWHVANFDRLARRLRRYVDEVVVSFAHPYRKTRRNVEDAARAHGFTWHDPPDDEKRALLTRLANIADEAGLAFSVCAQPDLLPNGAAAARCIDAARLADLAGRPIEARTKGNRPGCFCAESRDIGAYDTCPHGCVYCYAVRSPADAVRRHRAQRPTGAILGEAGSASR